MSKFIYLFLKVRLFTFVYWTTISNSSLTLRRLILYTPWYILPLNAPLDSASCPRHPSPSLPWVRYSTPPDRAPLCKSISPKYLRPLKWLLFPYSFTFVRLFQSRNGLPHALSYYWCFTRGFQQFQVAIQPQRKH